MISNISILILTKNEERVIEKCINSVLWSNDIHVLDSFSDDKTELIAISLGAKITKKHFSGYASQRNFGLHNLYFKNKYVLILDADESVSQDLSRELLFLIKTKSLKYDGYRIKRIDFFYNKHLKHAQMSKFYIRLVDPQKARYTREINENISIAGNIGILNNCINHYPFSKGIDFWMERHNKYSALEARQVLREQQSEYSFSLYKAIFEKDFHIRRLHQKGLFNKLPFRPLIKFFYLFLIKKAWLDGYAGFTVAMLNVFYEFLISIKIQEIKTAKRINFN